MQGALTLNLEKLDKRDDFDNESKLSRLCGLSLSESALVTQLLISSLKRREVLMSYFIACLEEVSPLLTISPFNISNHLQLLFIQKNTPWVYAAYREYFYFCNYPLNQPAIKADLFYLQSPRQSH